MKKWMYLIFPTILLLVFLFYYNQETVQIAAREQAHAEQIAKEKADAEAKKKAAEEQAKVSADKRARDQKEADDKVAAEREAKYQAESKKIQDEIDQYTTDGNRYAKEGSDLEIELAALQQKREKDNAEDFDLLKQVEQARVDEQTAEMDIQRKVTMIANRADESSLAQMPPPPPKKD